MPSTPLGDGARFARALSLAPVFPPAYRQVANAFAIAPFTQVHVVFRRASGASALDTLVAFPANADSLALSFAIPLSTGAPESGELLTALLSCLDAHGNTVFAGGPVPVIATSYGATTVPIPLAYAGVGANAVSVRISPRNTTVASGDHFSFTATALDANGQAIPGTPVMFRTMNASLAALASPASGAGQALGADGVTLVVARLITGPADTAVLNVQAGVISDVVTTLAFATQPLSGIAGAALAPVVTALDSVGKIVTSFTGAVSLALGSSPGGATLGGTTTVNAVAGVATFGALSITKAATAYTLVASTGGVGAATSSAFDVVAAAAASIAKVAGDNQSGLLDLAGILLPTPLSVLVTDAYGNPVSGATVAWAVTLGDAALGSVTSQTNSSGIATNTLSLTSLIPGTRQVTAGVTGLTAVVFSATGL
jgi:hypothetical protein